MGARLDAALGYADLGRSIIPVEVGGKVPAISWTRYQSERADPERIRRWWSRADWNVGIVCGAVSGLVVLDIDDRHGGFESLARLIADHGLPLTPEAATPSGGVHLWFTHPGRPVPNSAGALGPGLDVRGDHGFVVVPPSVRPDGAYRWCEWLVECQPLPGWLLERLTAPAPPPPRPNIRRPSLPPSDSTRRRNYAQAALKRQLERLEATPEGQHSNQFFKTALSLGQLAHLGLERDTVFDAARYIILSIAGQPWTEKQIEDQFNSGWNKGIAEPWTPA